MKKHITLLSGLLMISGAFAQVKNYQMPMRSRAASSISLMKGDVSTKNEGTEKVDGALIFQDDFSQSSFMWTTGTSGQGTFQLGNNSSAGMTSVTQYMGAMASTSAANGFAFFNGVQYLLGGSVDPQNTWVMSDTIDLSSTGSISLTFEQRYRAFNTDVTYLEFSEDGGATWAQSIVVNGAVATNAAATQNTVTVDFPVNNTPYGIVRFRWENTSADDSYGSGYGWCVDDIKIYSGYGNNVEMVAPHSYVGSQALQYTQIPVSQSDGTLEMEFDANMRNKGYNDLHVNLNVTTGSYNQTGATVNSPAFMDSVVEVVDPNGYMIPSTVGVHNLTLTVGSPDSTLAVTGDDSASMPFQVTSWIMACDSYDGTAASTNGSFSNFSSQVTGDFTGIGSYYEIFQDGQIGGAQVGIATVPAANQASFIGQEIFITLLKYNGTDFEYTYQSDPIQIAASHFGNLVNIPFADPVGVTAGDFYIVLVNSYVTADGGVPIMFAGYHGKSTTVGTTGETYPDDIVGLASDPATPTIVEAPVVRVDFQSHVGINEVSVATGVTTAPNPFGNETTVSFNLKNDAAVSLTVTDMAGRTVYTVPSANMTAGAQTISIDGAGLNAGVYNYSLKVGDSVITNRIVKK